MLLLVRWSGAPLKGEPGSSGLDEFGTILWKLKFCSWGGWEGENRTEWEKISQGHWITAGGKATGGWKSANKLWVERPSCGIFMFFGFRWSELFTSLPSTAQRVGGGAAAVLGAGWAEWSVVWSSSVKESVVVGCFRFLVAGWKSKWAG